MKKLILIFLLASLSSKAQWNLVSANSLQPFVSASFISPDTGLIMGMYQGYQTFNSGISLDTLNNLSYYNNTPFNTEAFYLTDSQAYVVTQGSFGGLFVYKTVDMASTWNDLSPNLFSQGIFRSDFLNTQTGYIYSFYEDSLWITFDGGNNWSHNHLNFSLQSGTSEIPAIDFVNDSTGYLVGGDGSFAYKGVVARTEDYGQNWNFTFLPESYSLLVSVNFPSPDTGFAFAFYGGVYRTIDAGQTWDSISAVTPYTNSKIFFTTNNTGFIITGGDIYKTTDAGLTWNLNYSDTNNLYDICFVDTLIGYVVGEHGTILKTNNAGGIVGIHNLESKKQFQVFPNPADDVLYIKTDLSQDYTIIISDIKGQIVDNFSGFHYGTFQLYRLANGVYNYNIYIGNQLSQSGRIVKM